MSKINNVKDIEKFLEDVIDSYIISDINKLIEINEKHETSYPYLALAFSGIDFFGTLEKGIKNKDGTNKKNVGERFCWFIKEWMGKVNLLYKEECLARLIYNSCRNGILHNALLKNTFIISSFSIPKSEHLHLISKNSVFLHSIQFAEDFIEAQKKYREYISSSTEKTYIDELCKNLNHLLDENKKANQSDTEKII